MKVTYLYEGNPFGRISKSVPNIYSSTIISNNNNQNQVDEPNVSKRLDNINKDINLSSKVKLLYDFLNALTDKFYNIKLPGYTKEQEISLAFLKKFVSDSRMLEDYIDNNNITMQKFVQLIYGKNLIDNLSNESVIPIFISVTNCSIEYMSPTGSQFTYDDRIFSNNGYDAIFKNYNVFRNKMTDIKQIFDNLASQTIYNGIHPKFMYVPVLFDEYHTYNSGGTCGLYELLDILSDPVCNKSGISPIISMIAQGESLYMRASNYIDVCISLRQSPTWNGFVQNAHEKLIYIPGIDKAAVCPIIDNYVIDYSDDKLSEMYDFINTRVFDLNNVLNAKGIWLKQYNDINAFYKPKITGISSGPITSVVKMSKIIDDIYTQIKKTCNYVVANYSTDINLYDIGLRAFVNSLEGWSTLGKTTIFSTHDETQDQAKRLLLKNTLTQYDIAVRNGEDIKSQIDKLDEILGFDWLDYVKGLGIMVNNNKPIGRSIIDVCHTLSLVKYSDIKNNKLEYAKTLVDNFRNQYNISFFGPMPKETTNALYKVIGDKIEKLFNNNIKYVSNGYINLMALTDYKPYNLTLLADKITYDKENDCLCISFVLGMCIFVKYGIKPKSKNINFNVRIPILKIIK